jgi:hypothetical protein
MISYCTIGGRASTAWFVLTYLLGREYVRVYDGFVGGVGPDASNTRGARLANSPRHLRDLRPG